MKLYIETEDGAAKNHPAFEENLLEAFGEIPPNWELFIRLARPIPNVYQIFESDHPIYEKVDGVWTDVWLLRDMTTEEKTVKQQQVQTAFKAQEYAENWSAWTFDETLCEMIPPIPRPDYVKGKDIRWCGAENNWKEVPAYPVDTNQYKFDFIAWQWVLDVN